MATLAQRLRELRARRNYKQKDIADRLGISESAYGFYEQGRRDPSFDALESLAELYDVSIDYLFGRTDDPHGTVSASEDDQVPPEQAEFLKWVEENLESSFFYDFSKSPDEQKKEMMKSLRIVWELEKHRKPGQKQGE